jgi:septal ring factor EnvC (AmiA/AmiB activator)
MFFFEKKNQKTFTRWRTSKWAAYAREQEFFASFFQKRSPFFLVFFLLATGPHDAAKRLNDTERAQAAKLAEAKQAEQHQAEAAARAAALAQQRVAAAARLRTIEAGVDDTARRLQAAAAAAQAADTEVERRTADLEALLPLALRLSLYPSETILAAPAPPEQAVEGLLATRGISAEVARQVAELRRRQAEAAALKDQVARAQVALNAQRAQQQGEAAALDEQVSAAKQQAQAAQDDAAAATRAAAALAARATDLRAAINALAAAQREAAARAARDEAAAAKGSHTEAAQSARARRAALSRPAGPGLAGAAKISLVAGHVVRAWGAPAEDGPATGITIGTAPSAFVSSPCTGRVGFAAPFRSYGRLMIIECGGGYDFVLAGLDRLDAAVGAEVRAGEPVGRMPDYDPAGKAAKPGLYVELRRGGQPVDPMPYLNKG